jgi:hypothetical protein
MKVRTPSAAMITAVCALVLALGGTAVASGYLITRVGQIKPSVRHALKGNRGPRGFTGSPGSAGIAGVHVVNSAPVSYCTSSGGACAVAGATAQCPSGSFVVGGAANADSIETSISTFAGETTYAAVSDNSSDFTGSLTATAICASGPGLSAFARQHSAGNGAAYHALATLRAQASQR